MVLTSSGRLKGNVGVVVLYLWVIPLLPHYSSSQDHRAAPGPRVCSVSHGYKVTGFGGATCALKFPCSARLAKFSVRRFLHYRYLGCVLDLFSSGTYQRPMHRLPEVLRPRTVWVHLMLFNLHYWEALHLDLLTFDTGQPDLHAFRFVSPPSGLEFREVNGSVVGMWQGVAVVTSISRQQRSAVMTLPQFGVTVRFNRLDLDLVTPNLTLMDQPAIDVEAPSNARWSSPTYNSGPYASYSLCGTPSDDARFWRKVGDRLAAESKTQACLRFAVTSHGDPAPPRPLGLVEERGCEEAAVKVARCERRQRAIQSCAPILHRPLLLRCLYNALTKRNVTANTTSPTQHSNVTGPPRDDVTLPVRLFKSCLLFVCTGNTAFCRLLGRQRGNASVSEPQDNSTKLLPPSCMRTRPSPHGNGSGPGEVITWTCQSSFPSLLQESLCRGCEEVAVGDVGPHSHGKTTSAHGPRSAEEGLDQRDGLSSDRLQGDVLDER